jgi:hypothetical protein
MNIPVIGIPIYNRVDLLLRCIRSIDFPVELLVVVNNGGLSLRELHEQVWRECETHDDIGDVQIFDPDERANIGVAGAWNYLLHQHLSKGSGFRVQDSDPASYVLICNNDIQWAPGDLEKMHACVRLAPHLHAVFGNWSYSNFLITRAGRDFLGYFDENFWPAYCEDGDHWRRIILSGAAICHAVGVAAVHGEKTGDGGQGTEGSCTIHSDPELAARNSVTQSRNWEYYVRKWGFLNDTVRETFKYPFDDPQQSLDEWALSEGRKGQPCYFGCSEDAARESIIPNVERPTPNAQRPMEEVRE